MVFDSGHRPYLLFKFPLVLRSRLTLSLLALLPMLLAGCARFTPKPAEEFVYVSAKRTFLRDRLAAVSNRVGEVSNGQKLLVLDRARRFVKVKDDKGEIGWIDGHAIIEQKVYDQFSDLAKQHAKDPVIATGVLRDDAYLHQAPGRQTDRFYLLAENAKLQLITRASVPKPMPPQGVPVPAPAVKSKTTGKKGAAEAQAASAGPPAVPMQDWWLVRDAQGQTGWLWSRMMDIDIPAEIAGLSEGQRYVGAYLLRTVDDPDSSFPNGKAPEYVTVINSWQDGLPYDFDQVRVFTWNTRKHRYETAFRQRNLEGYLPVTVSSTFADNQQEPEFSFKVATAGDVTIDPATGVAHAAQTEVQSYRLEGVIVKKAGPATAPAARPANAPPLKKRGPERHKRHSK